MCQESRRLPEKGRESNTFWKEKVILKRLFSHFLTFWKRFMPSRFQLLQTPLLPLVVYPWTLNFVRTWTALLVKCVTNFIIPSLSSNQWLKEGKEAENWGVKELGKLCRENSQPTKSWCDVNSEIIEEEEEDATLSQPPDLPPFSWIHLHVMWCVLADDHHPHGIIIRIMLLK